MKVSATDHYAVVHDAAVAELGIEPAYYVVHAPPVRHEATDGVLIIERISPPGPPMPTLERHDYTRFDFLYFSSRRVRRQG